MHCACQTAHKQKLETCLHCTLHTWAYHVRACLGLQRLGRIYIQIAFVRAHVAQRRWHVLTFMIAFWIHVFNTHISMPTAGPQCVDMLPAMPAQRPSHQHVHATDERMHTRNSERRAPCTRAGRHPRSEPAPAFLALYGYACTRSRLY